MSMEYHDHLHLNSFRCERTEGRYLSANFQVTQDNHLKLCDELQSVKWQLGLRWKVQSDRAGFVRQNNTQCHIIPFIKMIPNPGVTEKLGDVWIVPGDVTMRPDCSIERQISLSLDSHQPIVLRKSRSFQCELIPEESAIKFSDAEFKNTLVVDVEVILIRNTVDTIEQVAVPPCPVLHDFGTLLGINEEESKEKFCDVKVTATQQAEDNPTQSDFYAHKAILAARSPVLAKMFSHDMRENVTNTLNLPDITPDVLKELLTYIYTGETPYLKKYAESLLLQAEKYELTHLKSLCEKRLSFDLQVDNAAEILLLADACSAQQLKRNTLLFISKHGDEVQQTEEWKDVKKNAELLSDLVDVIFEPAAKRRKMLLE